jgi:hypothetical protein
VVQVLTSKLQLRGGHIILQMTAFLFRNLIEDKRIKVSRVITLDK